MDLARLEIEIGEPVRQLTGSFYFLVSFKGLGPRGIKKNIRGSREGILCTNPSF